LCTALEELATALADQTQEQEIILGRPEELPQPPAPAVMAKWQALRSADDRDTFALLVHAGVLHLLGNTPRGVLQAVFILQEMIAGGEALAGGGARRGPRCRRRAEWPARASVRAWCEG